MSHASITPEERFATIVEELLHTPGVTPPSDGKRFGSSALKIQNKIFAMLVRGQLVVKLPKARVDALVASGAGERYHPRHYSRLTQERLILAATSHRDSPPLPTTPLHFH